MPLKYEVESLDGVEESVRGLYEEKDGRFVLAVEGVPKPGAEDLAGLKRKVDELLGEKKAAQQKAKEAEERADAARLDRAKKDGDVDALTKSWEKKYSDLEAQLHTELHTRDSMVQGLTVDLTATELASRLAVKGSAEVLLPHIRSRMKTEIRDGKPVVVILDENGAPSALTLQEFEKDFVSRPAFAPLIAGSRANGAGHRGNGTAGGMLYRDKMTPSEKVEYQKEHGQAEYLSLPKSPKE